MTKLRNLLISGLILLSAPYAMGECLSPEETKQMVEQFPNVPFAGLGKVKDLDEAYCSQKHFVQALSEKLGPSKGKPIGFKVGFTGKGGQKKFGIPHPAIGVLLNNMFIENQAEIEANFGFRPMIEPDLMVVVKDNAIMQATTIKEVAQHLDTLHACIEMPTILFPPKQPFTAKELVAINVGATHMVLGEGIKVQTNEAFLNKLPLAQTSFVDDTGKLIQTAPLKNLMGHPFNAILWLIPELKKQGMSLKKGDYVSLGAVGKLFPLKNENRSYSYQINLPKSEAISATVKVNKSQ